MTKHLSEASFGTRYSNRSPPVGQSLKRWLISLKYYLFYWLILNNASVTRFGFEAVSSLARFIIKNTHCNILSEVSILVFVITELMGGGYAALRKSCTRNQN